jgi:hypothetical protein
MMMIWTVATCPKHEVVKLCACGLNTICYACGQGQGAYPCNCKAHYAFVSGLAPEKTTHRTPDLGSGSAIPSDDFDEPMELVDSRRLRFLEVLERSIKEHADIWRELAKY